MITVHHLNDSRSQRILWLLEELGLEYEVVRYARDATTRFAPASLKAVHPLGKSPVITEGDLTVAESGAIVEYVLERHGAGRLMPARGGAEHVAYMEWLHFAEGSAMLPLLLDLYTGRLGDAAAPLRPRIDGQIASVLGFVDTALRGRSFLVGDGLTGADVMMIFPLEAARGRLDAWPDLVAYVERMQARPAYRRSVERGGPYALLRRPAA